jgi:hypothetical protein
MVRLNGLSHRSLQNRVGRSKPGAVTHPLLVVFSDPALALSIPPSTSSTYHLLHHTTSLLISKAPESPAKVERTKNGRGHGRRQGQKEKVEQGQEPRQGRQQGINDQGTTRSIACRSPENEADYSVGGSGKAQGIGGSGQTGLEGFGGRWQDSTHFAVAGAADLYPKHWRRG